MATLSSIISELVYAAAGAILGYLLMKIDDTLNNKQYTYKEYSKFTLACYLVSLAALLLLRFIGPVSVPGSMTAILVKPQYGGSTQPNIGTSTIGTPISLSIPAHKPSIPSNGTAFFQPANSSQSLRFASGTPTF